MAFAGVALGSNLDDRLALLRAALDALRESLPEARVSPVYETAPLGYLDQPPFLNAVAVGETALAPPDLLQRLQAVERTLGRERPFPNAPRTIDLDLLFSGDATLDTPDLILPHPRLHERHFVLVPLADVAPGWRIPRLDRTARELLAALGPPAGVTPTMLTL